MKGDKRTVALVAVVGIEALASLLCDAAGEGELILHTSRLPMAAAVVGEADDPATTDVG